MFRRRDVFLFLKIEPLGAPYSPLSPVACFEMDGDAERLDQLCVERIAAPCPVSSATVQKLGRTDWAPCSQRRGPERSLSSALSRPTIPFRETARVQP